MSAAGVLLLCLCLIGIHQNGADEDLYHDYDYTTDSPSLSSNLNDWLFDLIEESNVCDPNPCHNGALCISTSDTEFTCACPEPYVGKRCQKVKNLCENVKCGRGDCLINLEQPPFYECKCRPPFKGPDCSTRSESVCEPNPCENGGECKRKQRGFRCVCADGFTGKFCQTETTDCYEGNGESYRGTASVTERGRECLNWNSDFVLRNGGDPFDIYSDFPGLGKNNHCRNPDGDVRPWCYYKKKGKELVWDHCNIQKCSGDPTPPPTPVVPQQNPTMFSQCGKKSPSTQPVTTTRIYGGAKSCPGAHPWQVSLQVKHKGSDFSFQHYCGGILLSSCWVLTAAHCISKTFDYQVQMGGVNLMKNEDMEQTIPVAEIIVHENYHVDSMNIHHTDIALMKLQTTNGSNCANESSSVKAACLPEQSFPSGKECVVSGWGKTEIATRSENLLNARVLMIPEQKCKKPDIYGSMLDESMICAGILQGGVDSCSGDSGGPLICEQNGTYYVAGVVSWGVGCALENKPGVYANVLQFVDWIKSKIN